MGGACVGWAAPLDGRCGAATPRDLRDDLRELIDAEAVGFGQHDGAEHGILELAHIAGPAVAAEQRQRIGADRADVLALFSGDPGEEMPHQVGDILGTLAERREGMG